MSDGYLTVKVQVPLRVYRQLHGESQRRGVTVAALIAGRLVRSGRPSAYTPEKGAQVKHDRSMNMSFAEIGRALGVDHSTAKAWLMRYESEHPPRQTKHIQPPASSGVSHIQEAS